MIYSHQYLKNKNHWELLVWQKVVIEGTTFHSERAKQEDFSLAAKTKNYLFTISTDLHSDDAHWKNSEHTLMKGCRPFGQKEKLVDILSLLDLNKKCL